MDHYDVERIARDAAASAAGDVRSELQYELDLVRRELRDLESSTNSRIDELREEIAATNRVLSSRTDHLV